MTDVDTHDVADAVLDPLPLSPHLAKSSHVSTFGVRVLGYCADLNDSKIVRDALEGKGWRDQFVIRTDVTKSGMVEIVNEGRDEGTINIEFDALSFRPGIDSIFACAVVVEKRPGVVFIEYEENGAVMKGVLDDPLSDMLQCNWKIPVIVENKRFVNNQPHGSVLARLLAVQTMCCFQLSGRITEEEIVVIKELLRSLRELKHFWNMVKSSPGAGKLRSFTYYNKLQAPAGSFEIEDGLKRFLARPGVVSGCWWNDPRNPPSHGLFYYSNSSTKSVESYLKHKLVKDTPFAIISWSISSTREAMYAELRAAKEYSGDEMIWNVLSTR